MTQPRLPQQPAPAIDFAALAPNCAGKAPFANRGEARRALGRLQKRHKITARADIRPYRCATCGHWHLGGRSL